MTVDFFDAARGAAADLVDLERYPLDDLDGAAGRALVERCRSALDRKALAFLPGFLRPEALRAMAGEANALSPLVRRQQHLRTPYGWMNNAGFPPGHPRAALHRLRQGTLLNDRFPGDSLLRGLFQWDALTEFVRRALGFATLYRSACPYLSLMANVLGEGDELAWHFDTNDGVVSLMLQAAEAGGDFEYAPYIRSEEDENYAAVARLFEGGPGLAERPPIMPGSFCLFKGRRSIHRVSRVRSAGRPRIMALFSYDAEPGMVFPHETVRRLIAPDGEPHLGAPA